MNIKRRMSHVATTRGLQDMGGGVEQAPARIRTFHSSPGIGLRLCGGILVPAIVIRVKEEY